MNDNKPVNRIPFEDISSSAAWDFPSWDDGAKVVSSVKKKTPPPAAPENERVEEVDEAEQSIKPITAAQLQQISEEAEREGREHGYKEGYEQGFSEAEKKGLKLGEQKAYAEVKQRLNEERDRFTQLADALLDPVAMQDGELENLVLDMAVHLAKHLLGQELNSKPERLYDIVKHAAASLPAGAENVRVYLHPDDVAPAQEACARSGRDWTFYQDAALGRGGCRIESSQSLIDYSVEQRLKQMLEQVHFNGEVDPEQLAAVADYRPSATAESPAEPAAESPADSAPADEAERADEADSAGSANKQEVATDTAASTEESMADKQPQLQKTQQSEESTPPSPETQAPQSPPAADAHSDADASSAHTFGNPWDGRRE